MKLIFPTRNTNTILLFHTYFLREPERLTAHLCISREEIQRNRNHRPTPPLDEATKRPPQVHNKKTTNETTTAPATKRHPAQYMEIIYMHVEVKYMTHMAT
jgi:hypothetical protein